MAGKRTQMVLRQKAYFEQRLKERSSVLAGKGVKSPQADKDTLVRKWQADIRAMDRRLRTIAESEKRARDVAGARAAGRQKEQEAGQGEKPKKAAAEGQGKKVKAEAKTAPPKTKTPEGGQKQKTTGSPTEPQAGVVKKVEEGKKQSS
jgi:hypothetical protein